MKLLSWILTFISFFSLCGNLSAQTKKTSSLQKIVLTGPAQGTSYHITYFHQHNLVSKQEVDSILQVIDYSMSIYNSKSTISQFNQSKENENFKLDAHFQKVIEASFYYHQITKGIFDITVAPLVQLWGFGPQKIDHFPDSILIAKTLESVGMKYFKWKSPVLQKLKSDVKIDLNGIAQGYSVDVLADFLDKKKIKNYIVELGGEMRVKGKNLKNESFKIGIERPISSTNQNLKTDIVTIPVGALTTAGNFEKFMMKGKQKISHHINPMTGGMFTSPIISVTVYAKTAMEADALDNYFMALNPDEVLSFVKNKKNVEVYIIFINKNGEIEEAFSKGFANFMTSLPK